MRLLLATANPGKLREARALLPEFEWLGLADLPPLPPAVEDGDTFEENARRKALHYAPLAGLPTVGEDSGLCVDALRGRPGVRSARYGGETSDLDRCLRLLSELGSVPPAARTASFHSCAALCRGGSVLAVAHGEVHGLIAAAPSGSSGFGYDPVFLFPPLGRTFAQLSLEEKSAVSHRRAALLALRPSLLLL